MPVRKSPAGTHKFTVVGDPHAVPDNLDQIGMLFDIIEDIGNPTIILGDLFDTKSIIQGQAFNYVKGRIRASKLHFHILVGNHDWFNLKCEAHSLETFKDLPNVTIVDAPTFVESGKGMLLMPYYDDLDAFRDGIKLLESRSPRYLFMHQGVVGFDYGNGRIADGNGHGEMDATQIQQLFEKIISGHFHKFAEVGNLMFLGTPFSHDFGETDQAKYIGVFDSETGEMELVETPFARHRTRHYELWDDAKAAAEMLKNQINDHNAWRIILHGTEMQISAFDKAAFPNVKFLEEATDADQNTEVSLKDTDSNEQKFLIWAKEIKQLDDQTIALGLELLEEAV